jgi:hypothetical protein
MLADRAPDARALSTLRPTDRSVTSPISRPLDVTLNAPVTSRPSSKTRTRSRRTPLGTTTSTSTSPAEMTSARFESTWMRRLGLVAALAAVTLQKTKQMPKPTTSFARTGPSLCLPYYRQAPDVS